MPSMCDMPLTPRTSAAGASLLGPALALLAAVLVGTFAVPSARAESIDPDLAEVGQAYRDGNYRLAAAKLTKLAGSADRFLPSQRLIYWDLYTNVAEASGLLAAAEQSAVKHLSLLKRSSSLTPEVLGALERRALVRLAQIKRTAAGADRITAVGGATFARALQQACAYYRDALQIATASSDEPLWEAETRLEFARTLAVLKQSVESTVEYAAASRSAEVAMPKMEKEIDATQFVRAATIICEAFLPTDALAPSVKPNRRCASLNVDYELTMLLPPRVENYLSQLQTVIASCSTQRASSASCSV